MRFHRPGQVRVHSLSLEVLDEDAVAEESAAPRCTPWRLHNVQIQSNRELEGMDSP